MVNIVEVIVSKKELTFTSVKNRLLDFKKKLKLKNKSQIESRARQTLFIVSRDYYMYNVNRYNITLFSININNEEINSRLIGGQKKYNPSIPFHQSR